MTCVACLATLLINYLIIINIYYLVLVTVCLKKNHWYSTPIFSAQELPQKFVDFFTIKIVFICQKLNPAVVPSSSLSDTVYSGPKLCGFEPDSEQFVKKIV